MYFITIFCLCVPDVGYYILLNLSVPDVGYYNLLTLSAHYVALYNLLTLSVADEGYSRKVLCELN